MLYAFLVGVAAFVVALAVGLGPVDQPADGVGSDHTPRPEGPPMAKHSRPKTIAAAIIIVGLASGIILTCAGLLAEMSNR